MRALGRREPVGNDVRDDPARGSVFEGKSQRFNVDDPEAVAEINNLSRGRQQDPCNGGKNFLAGVNSP